MKNSKDRDYAYSSAYIRTLENKMLNAADMEALLNASSVTEALKMLINRGYGGGRVRDAADAEDVLRSEAVFVWDEVRTACPKNSPLELFIYQNDFHNLKTILKALFSEENYQPALLYPHIVLPEEIHHAVTRHDFEVLPPLLKKPAKEAYDSLSRKGDGQSAEIILDKACFSAMLNKARESKSRFLTDWVNLNITLANAAITLRAGKAGKSSSFILSALPDGGIITPFIPADTVLRPEVIFDCLTKSGFKDGAEAVRKSYGEFERWCDRTRMDFVRPARRMTFGLPVVSGFLIRKQYELKTIRIVLAILRCGISADILRERMRELYV